MDSNDRSIARFTMIGHATFHAYELTIPLFVVVWLDVFGVSAAVLGTVVAVGYALIGIGAVPSGILSDSYGSKTLVTASILGMGGGFLLVSASPTITELLSIADSPSIAVLAIALILWGAAASVYHPAALSLITRGSERQGTVLAYHGAAGNVGTALGPFVAAILLTFYDWQLVAALFALPAVVIAVLAFRLEFDETAGVDEEITTDGGGEGQTFREVLAGTKTLFASAFLVVFGIAMLAGIYYRGVFTFLPDVLADLAVFDPVVIAGESFDPSQYLYAGLLMLGAVGQIVGGKLSDRVNPESAIIGAFAALVAVSLLFVPAAGLGTGAFLVVCAVLGVCVYLYAPILQSLVGVYAPAEVHGLSFGYVYLGTFGVGAAGASIAGIALTYGGASLVFLVLAAFPAAALSLAAVLLVRARRH